MKNKIKKIIPNKILNFLYKVKHKRNIKKFFRLDYVHLKRKNRDNQKDKLLGIITKEYHRIEKGLSHKNFRYGFGGKVLTNLIEALNEYYEKRLDCSNIRIKTALSTLYKYYEKHANHDIDLFKIKELLDKYNFHEDNCLGGVKAYLSDEVIKKTNVDFESLAKNRHSVRYFSKTAPSEELIKKSIETALNTPSVCNRQGWNIHLIKDENILNFFNTVHNGFAYKEQNLSTLILITFIKDYFVYPNERHQGYIDGGLISMSLLYSLASNGLATCALNANIGIKNVEKLKKLLNFGVKEDFIMFIAVGNYDKEFTSPKSQRDSLEDRLIIH